MEYNAAPALGELPGSLSAGQPPTDYLDRRSIMIPHDSRITTSAHAVTPSWSGSVWATLAVLCLTAGCSNAPRPGTAPRPEEAWVAATCLPAAPDTTGWKVYRLSDVELAVPAEFTVRNRTSRSIEFVRGGSVLSLLVSTSPTREIFYAAGRPALAKEEAGCTSSIGGYPGVVMATTRASRSRFDAERFRVDAEWDGAALWGPDDWRKRLIARMTTGSLRDAQRLRDALHTIRVARDTSLTRHD